MDACVHHVPVPVFELDQRCGSPERCGFACLHCARELPELPEEEGSLWGEVLFVARKYFRIRTVAAA